MIHNDTVYCVMIYVSEVSKRPDHKLSLLQKGLGGVMSAGVFLFGKFCREGGEEMEHNREYRLIAQRLLKTLPEFEELRTVKPRIAYLTSMAEKKKNKKIVCAECFLVEEKYKWCCPYDFFIVVYVPNVIGFTKEQLEILMRHELHHVGIDYKDSGIDFYIVPHDIEEFWDIIHEHGLNWSDVYAAR